LDQSCGNSRDYLRLADEARANPVGAPRRIFDTGWSVINPTPHLRDKSPHSHTSALEACMVWKATGYAIDAPSHFFRIVPSLRIFRR
jgi:hypothetical protein